MSDVPAYPIEDFVRNAEQERFYDHWLRAWRKGTSIDINGEHGYLFDYMHDLIGGIRWRRGAKKIITEIKALREAYPYEGWKKSGSFHHYSLGFIADAQVVLKQYDQAIETLSEGYRLPISIPVDKLLSLKLHVGGDVSGYDLLFLQGMPKLTKWGRTNLPFVAESAEDILQEYHDSNVGSVLSTWEAQVPAALKGWDPALKDYPLFHNVTHSFSTKVPYRYFSYLRPFSQDVTFLAREAENLARTRSGIPQVGEGWLAETELYNLVKDRFSRYRVEHHASPTWLGRQHLDIYIPRLKVAIEYQGAQHDKPVDFFGGEAAFKKTQERDAQKLALCEGNGVRLVYVRPGYDFEEVIAEILD